MHVFTKEIKNALKHQHTLSTFCVQHLTASLATQQLLIEHNYNPNSIPTTLHRLRAASSQLSQLLNLVSQIELLLDNCIEDYSALKPAKPKSLHETVAQP